MRLSDCFLQSALGWRFRLNREYELLPIKALSPNERKQFAVNFRRSGIDAILRPRKAGLTIKALTRDVCSLLRTLVRPCRIRPEYLPNRWEALIAKLLLDEVIELETPQGFVRGVRAYPHIFEESLSKVKPSVLATLSVNALKSGQCFCIDDPAIISTRLYMYNRMAASPAWRRMFSSTKALSEQLGIHGDQAECSSRGKRWKMRFPTGPFGGWYYWILRENGETLQAKPFKLYVSPTPEHLPAVFRTSRKILVQTKTQAFKVGSDLYGVLRPDKLVAYFSSFQDLSETADQLGKVLRGCPVHGVPFSAQIDQEGLLSWGLDPPDHEAVMPWDGTSWRQWVCNLLAVALSIGRRGKNPQIEPWLFALNRLALEGVEASTWIPRETIWADEN